MGWKAREIGKIRHLCHNESSSAMKYHRTSFPTLSSLSKASYKVSDINKMSHHFLDNLVSVPPTFQCLTEPHNETRTRLCFYFTTTSSHLAISSECHFYPASSSQANLPCRSWRRVNLAFACRNELLTSDIIRIPVTFLEDIPFRAAHRLHNAT